jgi:hypothetical protein
MLGRVRKSLGIVSQKGSVSRRLNKWQERERRRLRLRLKASIMLTASCFSARLQCHLTSTADRAPPAPSLWRSACMYRHISISSSSGTYCHIFNISSHHVYHYQHERSRLSQDALSCEYSSLSSMQVVNDRTRESLLVRSRSC